MALKNFPYKTIDQIIKKYLDDCEDSYTNYLLKKIKVAKRKGYLKREELVLISNWKSPRSINRVKSNKETKVITITRKVLGSDNEEEIIRSLKNLEGVSIAMASAILMFIDPKKYPVIDIRAWEVLYELKIVTENESGKNLSIKNWLKYLEIIRTKAKEYKVSARQVEKSIFLAHKIYQDGNLYKKEK